MSGKIESGQLVTLEPANKKSVRLGDIVLGKVNGVHCLHLVKAIGGERFQIGNNRGRVNGWTSRENIFGHVVQVSSEPLRQTLRNQYQAKPKPAQS